MEVDFVLQNPHGSTEFKSRNFFDVESKELVGGMLG
jgi:hypothetical protein